MRSVLIVASLTLAVMAYRHFDPPRLMIETAALIARN